MFRFLFAHRIADTAVAADALNDIKSLAPKIQKLEEIVRLQNEGLFNDDVGRRLVSRTCARRDYTSLTDLAG